MLQSTWCLFKNLNDFSISDYEIHPIFLLFHKYASIASEFRKCDRIIFKYIENFHVIDIGNRTYQNVDNFLWSLARKCLLKSC